jgi:hypothetical protein
LVHVTWVTPTASLAVPLTGTVSVLMSYVDDEVGLEIVIVGAVESGSV